MFQIGLPEIILIALVVLVLVNPKELPGMMRKLGRLAAGIRSMREGFLREMRDVDERIRGSADSTGKAGGNRGGRGGKPRA